MASTTAPARTNGRPPLWLWAILAAIVALIAVLAVVLGGDDDTPTPATTPATAAVPATTPATPAGGTGGTTPGSGAAGASIAAAESQPVTVTGTPLQRVELDTLASPFDDPAVGTIAPSLTGYTMAGAPLSITPGNGTPYMVVFLAHWCPHCNREIPVLNQWNASGAVPEGLQVVGVSTGVDSKAPNYPPSKWMQDMSWSWPALADSATQDAAKAYGLTGYPFFVVVGADGKVKVRNSGEISMADLSKLVNRALNS